MVSKFPHRLLFFLSLLLLSQVAPAQSAGDEGKLDASRTYRKVSGDTVRLRPSVAERLQKEEKQKARAEAKKAKETAKTKKTRVKKSPIDSVQYTPRHYALGQRVIMRGDSGHDVLSVARILVKKIYMDEADIIYASDGGAVYEGAMVKAILLFQEFNGFYKDGIIGHELIKALRKKK